MLPLWRGHAADIPYSSGLLPADFTSARFTAALLAPRLGTADLPGVPRIQVCCPNGRDALRRPP